MDRLDDSKKAELLRKAAEMYPDGCICPCCNKEIKFTALAPHQRSAICPNRTVVTVLSTKKCMFWETKEGMKDSYSSSPPFSFQKVPSSLSH